MKTISERACEWIISADTGTSSKTIWAVMMFIEINNPRSWNYGTPSDPSDFGRCYRLLQSIPEWRDRLTEIPPLFPAWGPIVREWDTLTALWEEEDPLGGRFKLEELLQRLVNEGRK